MCGRAREEVSTPVGKEQGSEASTKQEFGVAVGENVWFLKVEEEGLGQGSILQLVTYSIKSAGKS